jgi:hypothetical protein
LKIATAPSALRSDLEEVVSLLIRNLNLAFDQEVRRITLTLFTVTGSNQDAKVLRNTRDGVPARNPFPNRS